MFYFTTSHDCRDPGHGQSYRRDDQIRPVYMLYALASAEGVAARALAS